MSYDDRNKNLAVLVNSGIERRKRLAAEGKCTHYWIAKDPSKRPLLSASSIPQICTFCGIDKK